MKLIRTTQGEVQEEYTYIPTSILEQSHCPVANYIKWERTFEITFTYWEHHETNKNQ